jgi:hypothetical protein
VDAELLWRKKAVQYAGSKYLQEQKCCLIEATLPNSNTNIHCIHLLQKRAILGTPNTHQLHDSLGFSSPFTALLARIPAPYCLQLLQHPLEPDSLTLKMEAVCSFETSE